jgi:hypothetical protein
MTDQEKLEIELSRLLALSAIVNQNYEKPTVEEAKAIALGYIMQHRNWFQIWRFRSKMRKVNWMQVIKDSQDDELFRDVMLELRSKAHV